MRPRLALLGLLVSATCHGDTTLLVSAGASLQPALERLVPVFASNHPGVTVTFNFGASGSLAKQIDSGAPVDVFIAAGRKPFDELAAKGRLDTNTSFTLLRNTLVLITPTNAPALVLEQLTGSNITHVALGEPGSVPAGQYASETLKALGLWDSLQGRLVFAKDVRQVLAYVENGEADAGFIYASDAAGSTRVKVAATVDSKLHSPIVYPAAVVKDSEQPGAAGDFLTFLKSDEARSVFTALSFKP